jgi:2'-5' RNA ligase
VDAGAYDRRVAVHRRPGEATAVICAGFDPALDAAVLHQVSALRAVGLRVARPRHPPHLTLGAATVPADEVDQIDGLLAGLVRRVRPFALRLEHVGFFPGGVLWLGPQPTAALTALQADVDAQLRHAGHARAFADRCDPAHWVPHCTLARRLDPPALGSAVTRLAQEFRPLTGRVERLLTIRLGSGLPARVTPLGD